MAQIRPIDIVAPGAFGLNTESKETLLAPQWATIALNAVVNVSGRIGTRAGWVSQTTNAISGTPTIDVIHEYLLKNGTSIIITAANNKVYKDIDDYTDSNNDITSSTTPTADHWQFINFNGKVLGFQKGHTPIEWANSGDFIDGSYTGTGPDGNCAVAAFGRVWAADADLQTVRYSVLLDDRDYSVANGGGTLDMSSIWTQGMDEIVAIKAIGSNLIVFGRNHIVLWADGSGSEIGLDPTELQVVDTIEGTGCIARDSVQLTGEGDMIFLSRHGLQSLGRVIQSKSNPVKSLTKHVRTDLLADLVNERASDAKLDRTRAVVSPEKGLYIINFPVCDAQYVLDLNHPFEDEEGELMFPVTKWELGGTVSGMGAIVSGPLYFGASGIVGLYSGLADNNASYQFDFETGWLEFGELNHRLKMLKEIIVSVVIGTGTITYTWQWDFSGDRLTRSHAYTTGAAEYNIGEYNESEYSGGSVVQRINLPAHGEGQFLKLGSKATVSGFDVVIQHISISPKIGRMIT